MIVVLGADGFIGSHIFEALQKAGQEVVGTSFRPDPTGGRLQVDIRQPTDTLVSILTKASHVICAISAGSIDECAQDPVGTRAVNVLAMQQLLSHLGPAVTPVYLSTNMVFSGEREGYTENDMPSPTTTYGQQKLEMETWLAQHIRQAIIVRLTKVYGLTHGDGTMFTQWYQALQKKQQIRVAEDIITAPIFVGDVVSTILKLIEIHTSGLFHIPGPIAESIANFALQAAHVWHSDLTLVKKVTRADFHWQQVRPPFHTLVAAEPVRSWQKSFLTPQAAFMAL